MTKRKVPITTVSPPVPFSEMVGFDWEAYDDLESKIDLAMASQFAQILSSDPRILELDQLDGHCFTESPWTTYGENCCMRDNTAFEQALQETRAAFLTELDEVFREEYEQQGKNTEGHHQGREQFLTLVESLLLEHVPAFIARHPDLAVQYGDVTKQSGDFVDMVTFRFLDAARKACEATWPSSTCPSRL